MTSTHFLLCTIILLTAMWLIWNPCYLMSQVRSKSVMPTTRCWKLETFTNYSPLLLPSPRRKLPTTYPNNQLAEPFMTFKLPFTITVLPLESLSWTTCIYSQKASFISTSRCYALYSGLEYYSHASVRSLKYDRPTTHVFLLMASEASIQLVSA